MVALVVFALALRVLRLEAAFLRPPLCSSWWPRERHARIAAGDGAFFFSEGDTIEYALYDGYGHFVFGSGFFSVFLTFFLRHSEVAGAVRSCRHQACDDDAGLSPKGLDEKVAKLHLTPDSDSVILEFT